jgi:transposase-like protein
MDVSASRGRRDCLIESVGKQRNGNSRYWCTVHRSPATARYGKRMDTCEGAYREGGGGEILEIDPADYPGGIALWGAVDPVYDTMGIPAEKGIHVHARREPLGAKVHDKSFSEVRVPYARDLIERRYASITQETGVAYYLSRFLGRHITTLYCTYCGDAHLDAEWFAIKPHRRHLCHGCGRQFSAERSISNPVMAVRDFYRDFDRVIERASEVLVAKQADYPGGMQIWASNPAILWTASTPEHDGIHVHADGYGHFVDETFDRVVLDGIELNEQHLRLYMAQKAVAYLADKVVSINCPDCGLAHCDVGDDAFRPHQRHICHDCGAEFVTPGRRKLVVSNPFVETVSALRQAAIN